MTKKEISISDAVKKVKADIKAPKKRGMSDCCSIEYDGDNEIKRCGIEVAENGFSISVNYGENKILATTAKEAGEAIEELLS